MPRQQNQALSVFATRRHRTRCPRRSAPRAPSNHGRMVWIQRRRLNRQAPHARLFVRGGLCVVLFGGSQGLADLFDV